MVAMRTRRIVGTTVELTELGFGGASIGNLYRETSDEDAQKAVDAAWALGIRYFDTAPHYGLGLSESRLGRALARYPRDEFVISTKVGRLLVPNESRTGRDPEGFEVPDDYRRELDYSRDGILRSVDASLERLGLDRIDIVYVHDPDAIGEDTGAQAAETLIELREQNIVRAVGVGSNSSAEIERLFDRTDSDVAMLAGRYTLLEQGALDDALAAAERAHKSVVAVGVFNSGLLASDRPAADATYNYAPADRELIARANRIADVCEAHGVTLPEAAIAFALAHPLVVGVALGMRNAEQVERNVALYGKHVPAALWDDLREQSLLRADAPIASSR
jgi:D-threo-aldose 1-dehydrogenase